MASDASVLEILRELIAEGETLVPRGGTEGYNDKLQPEYVAWRHRSIAAIQELGQRVTAILKDLDADRSGPYFYQSSAGRVLGSLRAALAIAQRHAGQPGANSSARPFEPSAPVPQRVFLVHGHDRALLEQTARFLEKLDIEPVILFEQAGAGRTIIEAGTQ